MGKVALLCLFRKQAGKIALQIFLQLLQISLEDRRGIPHHLLDILDPKDDFSAGDFFERSRTAIQDILQVHTHNY